MPKGLGFKNRQNVDSAFQAGKSGASKPPNDDDESLAAWRAGRREYIRKQNLDPAKKAMNNRGRDRFKP